MPDFPPPLTGFIAGAWLPASQTVVTRENPGRTDEVAARWCPARPEDARSAMEAAAAAFASWASRPLPQRAALLDALADGIEAATEKLATCISRESGKTRAEAHSEVAAGLRDARCLVAQARLDGQPAVSSPAQARVHSAVAAEPVGVFVVITPWNFPLATILRKLFPALVYGNTAVVKPSELTPGPAHALFELITQTSLPPGIAALIPGSGADVGAALLGHASLRGISFTGSTRVGLEIARVAASRDVRLQLEMGGKNTLVVLADADLETAVEAAVIGGFSCAGQWCTGTGRVVVEKSVVDAFAERLASRVRNLRVGPGDAPDTDVGPVATGEKVDATLATIGNAVLSGARVRCGGERAIVAGVSGYYLQPTVVDCVHADMAIFIDELFAPVLPMAVARDADHAVALANAGSYGLAASVFSADVGQAQAIACRIEAGMIHVNLHTAYREPQLPVAAWRDSGRGVPECGRFAREFFTRPRAIYVRQP